MPNVLPTFNVCHLLVTSLGPHRSSLCQHFVVRTPRELVPTDNFPLALLLICAAFTNSVKLSQFTYLVRFLLKLFDYFKLVFVSKTKLGDDFVPITNTVLRMFRRFG